MKETRDNKTIPDQPRDVQLYGGGDALSHMAWRVKNCVPNGNRLRDNEALSLAQIALATGLNPFTGELWYIPGKGPMAGIRGLRRRAREQSTYSTDFRAMEPSELEEHAVGPDDVGHICELYRHDVLQKAVEINKAAGKGIVPIKPILGIGIWRKGDQIAATKSRTWMADKRAEADALCKGFDLMELPYSDEVNGAQFDIANIENPGWAVVPEPDGEGKSAEEHKANLFGDEDEIMRRQAAANAARRAGGNGRTPAGFRPQFLNQHGLTEKEALSALGPGIGHVDDWLEANDGKALADAEAEILAISGRA